MLVIAYRTHYHNLPHYENSGEFEATLNIGQGSLVYIDKLDKRLENFINAMRAHADEINALRAQADESSIISSDESHHYSDSESDGGKAKRKTKTL
tara:strand:+ start:1262 stop:1549 length:288 start_codon:yes stop_codon:yes gene_type:complete